MILSEQSDMKQHTQSTVGHTDNVCMVDTENPLSPPPLPPTAVCPVQTVA